MTMTNFVGAQKPLDAFDVPLLAQRINVSEDHLRAFLEVEAGSRGFDRQGRPVMLFEPHVFYRNLPAAKRQQAVDAGLAYQRWRPGAYPSDSYPRLLAALQIDETAALKACSIGLSQVLVENHSQVGYATPQQMWQAFMDDEENHVEAMVEFILRNGIDDDLRNENWSTVARVYNGPRYAENGYHTKMAAAFAKFRRIPDVVLVPGSTQAQSPSAGLPDAAMIRRVQERLIELGYPEVGRADGAWGSKTRTAVLGFRADHGLPLVAEIDDALLTALMVSPVRAVSEERATTTAADLRDAGSRKVAAADQAEIGGVAVGVGGVVTAVTGSFGSLREHVDSYQALFDSAAPLIESIKAVSPILLLAVGAYVVYQAIKVKRATVEDYREGKYVGR